MRKNVLFILSSFLMIVLVFTSCKKDSEEFLKPVEDQSAEMYKNGDIIPGQYIIFKNSSDKSFNKLVGVENYTERQEIMKEEIMNIFADKSVSADAILQVFSNSIYGFSGKLSQKELDLFRSEGFSIEPDRFVALKKPTNPGGGGGEDPTQVIPWGITRVNGGTSSSNSTAWILDSGIDLDHPDLNVDVNRSADFTGSRKGAEDENGHGTHVAGTIAALDNDFGVVGVAPGTVVVAVRVLNRRGSGTYSGIIAGVDYVANMGSSGDVANMSLGGPASSALDDAVVSASNSSGVKFVLAAGNESDDANNHSPARANGSRIYTISAMDINDVWAYFSNYGNPPVDYCAPGYNIYSTYKSGAYTTMSGTSMAAPHAAGVLLLGSARTDGYVINDPDGDADPIIVH